MPRGDGTGPNGMGPKTGWGRGLCGPVGSRTGYHGTERGGGRGWRNRFWASGGRGWNRGGWTGARLDPESDAERERRWLEQRSADLEAEHRDIKARLEAIAGEPAD
jgi:hypothetical protein